MMIRSITKTSVTSAIYSLSREKKLKICSEPLNDLGTGTESEQHRQRMTSLAAGSLMRECKSLIERIISLHVAQLSLLRLILSFVASKPFSPLRSIHLATSLTAIKNSDFPYCLCPVHWWGKPTLLSTALCICINVFVCMHVCEVPHWCLPQTPSHLTLATAL